MAGAYDGDMASAPRPIQAATNPGYVTVHVVSPQGDKHPLKVRPADDIATLRALCTQVRYFCAFPSLFYASLEHTIVWLLTFVYGRCLIRRTGQQ